MTLTGNRKKLLWAGLAVAALAALYAVGRVIHNPMAVMVYALAVAGYGLLLAYCVTGPGGIHSAGDLRRAFPFAPWNILIACAFIFIVMNHEKYIYFWDYGWYHELSIVYSTNYLTDTPAALELLYGSVNVSEYNYALPFLLSFPIRIFGYSRASYLMSVWLFFGFPASMAVTCGIRRYVEALGAAGPFADVKPAGKSVLRGFICLIVSLWPWVMMPILAGYIDAGGFLTAACLVVLTVTKVDWKRFSFKTNTAISLLLLIAMFQRRYFAIFAAGYVAGLFAHALVTFLYTPRCEKGKTFKIIFFSLLYIGGLSLGILLAFFRDFLEMSLMNNYAFAYSSFSEGGFIANMTDAVRKIGPLWVAVALAGAAITLIRKKGNAPKTVFLLVSPLVILVLLFRIQSMAEHHAYTLITQMFLLVFGCFAQILCFIKKKGLRATAALLMAGCLLGSVAYAYGGYRIKRLSFMSAETYYPKNRGDIDQIRELDMQLRLLTADNDRDVYMLADTFNLNGDILRKLDFPPSTRTAYPMLTEGHLDLRDGFPTDFLSAELIVMGDPVQYDGGDDQRIVSVLQAEVENPLSPIGKHFSIVGTPVVLAGNVTVNIYQKNSLFSKEDVEYLQSVFDGYYPEHAALFHDRIVVENQR